MEQALLEAVLEREEAREENRGVVAVQAWGPEVCVYVRHAEKR